MQPASKRVKKRKSDLGGKAGGAIAIKEVERETGEAGRTRGHKEARKIRKVSRKSRVRLVSKSEADEGLRGTKLPE